MGVNRVMNDLLKNKEFAKLFVQKLDQNKSDKPVMIKGVKYIPSGYYLKGGKINNK
jgi:hypothetical protein